MNKVYIVMRNVDLGEGKGPMVVEAVMENRQQAFIIADANEPYKIRGQFTEVVEWPVLRNAEVYIQDRNDKAKAKALAKLTREERTLLGV